MTERRILGALGAALAVALACSSGGSSGSIGSDASTDGSGGSGGTSQCTSDETCTKHDDCFPLSCFCHGLQIQVTDTCVGGCCLDLVEGCDRACANVSTGGTSGGGGTGGSGGTGGTTPINCPTPTGNVTLMASGFPEVNGLLVHGGDLYFGDDVGGAASVHKLPLAGGTPSALIGNQYAVRSLIVHGSDLYYAGGIYLKRVPLAGGSATQVGNFHSNYLAQDATHLFSETSSNIYAVTLANGGVSVLVEDGEFKGGLALTETDIYFTQRFTGTLARIPKTGVDVDAGVQPTVVLGGISHPWGLAVDGTHVFVVAYFGGQLIRVQLDGQNSTDLASGQDRPRDVVIDGSVAYWINEGADSCAGSVMRVDKAGGAPTQLAGGLGKPSSLAVDASFVYVTLFDSGEVIRVPK